MIMDTTLIDSALQAAVTAATDNPQRIASAAVAGWPVENGTSAMIQTDLYRTISGTGFKVTGTIVFPNGYRAQRIVDVGPNASQSKEWPKDIEAAATEYGAKQVHNALLFVARHFSQAEQTALLFKWGGVVSSGDVEQHPKLAAFAAWIASVSTAALTGQMFPQPPSSTFVELMAEVPSLS